MNQDTHRDGKSKMMCSLFLPLVTRVHSDVVFYFLSLAMKMCHSEKLLASQREPGCVTGRSRTLVPVSLFAGTFWQCKISYKWKMT